MSLADISNVIENDNRNRVMLETWGHLHPQFRKPYKGWILFAHSCHGDNTIIDWNFGQLAGSPWLYEDLHQFTCKFMLKSKRPTEAKLFRFDGFYMKLKNGNPRFSGQIKKVWQAGSAFRNHGYLRYAKQGRQ